VRHGVRCSAWRGARPVSPSWLWPGSQFLFKPSSRV
jgi:hypothetical protein